MHELFPYSLSFLFTLVYTFWLRLLVLTLLYPFVPERLLWVYTYPLTMQL